MEAPKPHFVRKMGENLKKDAVALTKGMQLTPSRIGLCATMGYATVPVYRRLRIGIVSTGDELKSPGESLKHGEIYESNSFGLAGLVEWSGHEPVRFPAVADSMEALRTTLNEAKATCDLILTSGGVSMGEFDYVRRLMEEEGDVHFWRMKKKKFDRVAPTVRLVGRHPPVWPSRQSCVQSRRVSDARGSLPSPCPWERRPERVDGSCEIVRPGQVNQRLCLSAASR